MINQFSSRKARRWLQGHVYRVYYFRLFLTKEQQKNLDPEERKEAARKKESLYKKIDKHMKYGETLHLNRETLRNLTVVIVERVQRGKKPKEIIEELEGKSQF